MICHCGAGTILDCLKNGVNVIGVVNDSLVDNHQIEIFESLKFKGYITGFEECRDIDGDGLEKCFEFFYEKKNVIFESPKGSIIERIALED